MIEAAEQAITIVDEEYRGQIKHTTEDLKNACQQLVNSAYPFYLFPKIILKENKNGGRRNGERRKIVSFSCYFTKYH